MLRYERLPTTIEVVRWDGANASEVRDFAGNPRVAVVGTVIRHLQLKAGPGGISGWVLVPLGHYVARNADDPSDLWPLAPGALSRSYRPLDPAESPLV